MKTLFPLVVLLAFFSGYRPQPSEGDLYCRDFDILVTSLRELDPMLYKAMDKPAFDARVLQVEDRLRAASTRNQAMYIMEEFMYDLGDSHASVTSVYGNLHVNRVLPFKVFITEGRLYIRNYPGDTTLNGTEILSIDRTPARAIIDSLKIFYPNDGCRDIPGFGLPAIFNSVYAAFCHEADFYDVETAQGMKRVAAVHTGDPLFEQLVAYSWTDYAFMDTHFKSEVNNDYGYFRFTGFERKEEGHLLEKEFDAFIDELNRKKIGNLVIDLRYNSGGDPYIAGRMASYFTTQPFPVFERLILTNTREPKYASYMVQNFTYRYRLAGTKVVDSRRQKIKFEKGLRQMQPAKNGFRGKVYVLVGSMTGSASTMFCRYIEDLPNVTFVGSETEGAVNYFCAHKHCELTLPNTGIYTTFGTLLIELKKESSDTEKPVGLIPDAIIHYSIGDLVSGEDKEMSWVINDIQHNTKN